MQPVHLASAKRGDNRQQRVLEPRVCCCFRREACVLVESFAGLRSVLRRDPGFRACDLVRNLLLSVYAARGLEEQEQLLLERWIEPIELRCAGGAHGGLDALIGAFLDREQAERGGGSWPACELERRVAKLEADAAAAGSDRRRPVKSATEVSARTTFWASWRLCIRMRVAEYQEIAIYL